MGCKVDKKLCAGILRCVLVMGWCVKVMGWCWKVMRWCEKVTGWYVNVMGRGVKEKE